MSAGILKLRFAGVPPDAPATLPGETPWYSGDDAPVQIGVYKRLSLGAVVLYSYFDGAHWLWNCRSPEAAVRKPSTELSLVQALPWCGLINPAREGYGPIPADQADQASYGGTA